MKKELKKNEKIIIRTDRSQTRIANNNCLKKFLERNNFDSITLKLTETKPGIIIPKMNFNNNDEKQNEEANKYE